MYSFLRTRERFLRGGTQVYNRPILLAGALDKLERLAQKPGSDSNNPRWAGFGCVVDLLDLNDRSRASFELVMPKEASPENGRISVLSPLGSSLLGLKKGGVSRVNLWGRSHNFQILDIRHSESVMKKKEETPP
ncbi:Transcription elongation factor GreA [Halioglobus japonicus]|nr:Transcription elongation factor GreA [Halioglobus japonicus]